MTDPLIMGLEGVLDGCLEGVLDLGSLVGRGLRVRLLMVAKEFWWTFRFNCRVEYLLGSLPMLSAWPGKF